MRGRSENKVMEECLRIDLHVKLKTRKPLININGVDIIRVRKD